MKNFVICKRVISEGRSDWTLQQKFNTHIKEIIKEHGEYKELKIINEGYSYLLIFIY